MSATTPPKRHPTHAPSGGDHVKKNYPWLLIGGVTFLAAWIVWTIWYVSALPP